MFKVNEIETDLTKQITHQDTSTWICPQCKSSETQYYIQIIPTGKAVTDFYPVWVPQIKEVCSICGRYRRFVRQSPMLITRFNERLEKIPLQSHGFRDGVDERKV